MVSLNTTSDIYSAVAEPRRRAILDFLAQGERPVNDVVDQLKLDQPAVSKHLRVLRDAGLVNARRAGRQRFYSVNGAKLKTMHDWTKTYDRFWEHQLDRIKSSAEQQAQTTPQSTQQPKNER